MLGPMFGRHWKGIRETNQRKRAAAASNGSEASLDRNTASASARFGCFTMFPVVPSKSWRSSPNPRPTYGWHDTQIPDEAGSTVRTEGRSLALSPGGREARDSHHSPRKASRTADRLPIGRRLVRLPPGERLAVPAADRKGKEESTSWARRQNRGHRGNILMRVPS